jgi:hypothetical protein
MSIPSIFAGTCIVFLIVCIIGYHHTNKEKKRQVLAAQELAAANRFTFPPQLRNDLINKLNRRISAQLSLGFWRPQNLVLSLILLISSKD